MQTRRYRTATCASHAAVPIAKATAGMASRARRLLTTWNCCGSNLSVKAVCGSFSATAMTAAFFRGPIFFNWPLHLSEPLYADG